MGSRGRVSIGLVGSVLVHAALAGWIASAWRPEPERLPTRLGPEVELVWLEDVRAPSADPVAVPVPGSTAVQPASAPEPAGAEPAPEPAPRVGSRRRAAEETPAPASGSEPSGSGLALSGLRGSTRSATGAPSAVVVPRLPPPPQPRVPRSAEDPVRPPRDDVQPRSLEEAGFKRRKDGSYKLWELGGVVTVKIHPNGRIEFRDRALSVRGAAVGHAGTVGQALAGEEQFKAVKAKILRQTFELRMNMARSWSREQMRKQLAGLNRQLQRTWARTDWSAMRRREVLFTLWDDCEEADVQDGAGNSVEATLDQARAEAGTKARKQIVAFIREELPASSPDAYPSAELKRLNASRHSRQRFEPYD